METEVLQVYQGPVTTDMVDGALFSELNTLAAVLSRWTTPSFRPGGMLKIRQEATGTQKIAISDILHMADNTDRCMVATHIWDTWPWDIFSMKQNSCPRAPPGCWM